MSDDLKAMREALARKLNDTTAITWLDGITVALEELAGEIRALGEAEVASKIRFAAESVQALADRRRTAELPVQDFQPPQRRSH